MFGERVVPIDPITIAWEAVKRLREISDKIKDAEAKNIIADLMMSLADVKTELVEAREEIAQLQKRDDLSTQLELRDDGFYYFIKDADNRPQGPYCSRCFTAKGELGLVKPGPMRSKICHNCNMTIHGRR